MHFDIVEANEDTDGEKLAPISQEQVRDLQALAEEVHADCSRFLSYLGVSHFDAILQRDYQKAVTALETKRKR